MGTKFDFQELEPVEGDEALVLTHPYHAVNQPDDPYLKFIKENNGNFNVYFVEGTRYVDGNTSYETGNETTVNHPRVDLPSGYTEGLYEGTVKESDTGMGGNIEEDEADNLLLDYNRIVIAGENLFMCQRRTYDDLLKRKNELDVDTDVGVMSEASFAPAVGLDGNERMYSLEDILEHDLPLYNGELLEVEFTGKTVNAYRMQ